MCGEGCGDNGTTPRTQKSAAREISLPRRPMDSDYGPVGPTPPRRGEVGCSNPLGLPLQPRRPIGASPSQAGGKTCRTELPVTVVKKTGRGKPPGPRKNMRPFQALDFRLRTRIPMQLGEACFEMQLKHSACKPPSSSNSRTDARIPPHAPLQHPTLQLNLPVISAQAAAA